MALTIWPRAATGIRHAQTADPARRRCVSTFKGRPFKFHIKSDVGHLRMEIIGWNTTVLKPLSERLFFGFGKGGEIEATFRQTGATVFDRIDFNWAGEALAAQRVE